MSAAPEVPLDIRSALQDCILALFWPKKKIVEFMESVGCPEACMPASDADTPRHAMVSQTFGRLSARADRGFAVFQTMIDRLSSWSYFDPFYFENLAKLDRSTAEQKIAHLKAAVEARNAKTEKRRATARVVNKQQAKKADLTALKSAFASLYGTGMTPQARGKLFETFLRELFNRQSVGMGDPFRLVGEEIDGTFKFEGENYIVEAKWQEPSVSTGQLYKFAHKVDGKMHGRGLFISVNGFSAESIQAIVHGKHIQTMLMDGEDLSHVLDERISLEGLLDYKIRAAQTRGEVYVCPLRHESKV